MKLGPGAMQELAGKTDKNSALFADQALFQTLQLSSLQLQPPNIWLASGKPLHSI